ncbi:NAD(P)/FAD-dependent oxidoreductase [Methylibium sp.]|uniref:NAD(P)/FAD-dependent oxidoreductase n=1 Tax=Methylibium sp. TaxID=2067992 RepID=UPI003D0E6957
MRRIAVVGSGISGLAAAYALARARPARPFDVTLFEAGDYLGGHTHTVDITLPGTEGLVSHGVDTGFLVFNHRSYPKLVALFGALDVATAPSEMSFSVQVPQGRAAGLEWSGCDLNTVFAQRRNLVRPGFWRMLKDILRFNRITTAMAQRNADAQRSQSIGDFLAAQRFSSEFRDWYFLPMIACIWSCPADQMLRFPVATMIRFCHNHGLIQVVGRPQWHTVRGGARHYVQKMVEHLPDVRLATPVRQVRCTPGGTLVATDAGSTHFDEVVFACHSDQALALLADPTPQERSVLGAIRYHANRAVLHTDGSVLPRRRLAWAAWNYERAASDSHERAAVCLHYLMNRLQPLPFRQPVVVSLNPTREPAPGTVLGDYDYAHPVFDLAAIEAQRHLPEIQGVQHRWFCGAWTGYGFHEDGLTSGLAVAQALHERHDAAIGRCAA